MKRIISIALMLIATLAIFIVPLEVKATSNGDIIDYELSYSIDGVNNPLTLDDSLNLNYGDSFTIDLSAIESSEHEFAFWVVDGNLDYNRLKENNRFVLTNNLSVTAIFNTLNKNVVGFIDHNDKLIETKYVTDNLVTEPLELPNKVGYDYSTTSK